MNTRAALVSGMQPFAHPRYRTIPQAGIIEMLVLSGWAFECEAGGKAEAVAACEAALEDWIALGLGFAVTLSHEKCFDPVEVVNFLILAGRLGLHQFWATRFVHTGRRLAGSAAPTGAATARYHLRLSRSFGLAGIEPGSRLRLRLPTPLEAVAHDLTIMPKVSLALAAEVTMAPGRIDARLPAPAGPIVTIGMEAIFRMANSRIDGGFLTLQDRELYLRVQEGLIAVTPGVDALARQLTQTHAQPWSSVQAIWDHLLDEFYCGSIHYDQLGTMPAVDWVLAHRWYDCQLASALFVSLCRAIGIPARMVGGHVLYRLAPTNHFWAEAWIEGEGWRPFDFSSWGLSLGGSDAAWRQHFFGQVDFRMVTQILPKLFTGPMSVRLPDAWHMVQTGTADGVRIAFLDLDGRLVFADDVALIEAG